MRIFFVHHAPNAIENVRNDVMLSQLHLYTRRICFWFFSLITINMGISRRDTRKWKVTRSRVGIRVCTHNSTKLDFRERVYWFIIRAYRENDHRFRLTKAHIVRHCNSCGKKTTRERIFIHRHKDIFVKKKKQIRVRVYYQIHSTGWHTPNDAVPLLTSLVSPWKLIAIYAFTTVARFSRDLATRKGRKPTRKKYNNNSRDTYTNRPHRVSRGDPDGSAISLAVLFNIHPEKITVFRS